MAAGPASADVVVIGSGVAGALIACELAKAGASVVVLEAGPRLERRALAAELARGPWPEDVTRLYPPSHLAPHPTYEPDNNHVRQLGPDPYRVRYLRAVGGTTWSWAGAAWRFLPADFRLHSLYGVGRDWPLTYADLEPFYARAEAELGVSGPSDVDLGSPRSGPYPMAGLPLSWNDQKVSQAARAAGLTMVSEPAARNAVARDGRPACCGAGSCMPLCPTGALYAAESHIAKAERAGARVVANAVVARLERGADGRIAAAHYVGAEGSARRITAGRFVLAAGGIETPRLLLMSGIANGSRQVGRNLMDHPGVGLSFLAREPVWSGRGPVELSSITSFRDGAFRSEAAAAKIHLSNHSHVMGATWQAIGLGLTGARLEAEVRRRASHTVSLGSFHEDLPGSDSRVEVNEGDRDTLGLPRPRVAYRVSDYVRRGAERTRAAMLRIAEAMGATEAAFEPGFSCNHHPMGATIMGTDGATSVVDADGRAHDHANLFIAGSSVFPSATSVNPTLTIAALTLRLADTLRAGH